jgi:hypothetical protein
MVVCNREVHRFALGQADSAALRKCVGNGDDNDRILDLIIDRYDGPDKARLEKLKTTCDTKRKAIAP